MKSKWIIPATILATGLLCAASVLLVTSTLAADSSNLGTLSGKVTFQGTAPKATRINMSTDPNCMKGLTTSPTTQDIVAGEDGALENVIVYIADGLSQQTYSPPTEPVVLEQKGCTYTPHVVALQAHQQLNIVNADKTTHNIHPIPMNNREWNVIQPPGVPLQQSFAREEIAIPVKCNIHPWMHGYIAVFKHPFFAVTGKDGNFDIKNVPPGSYTVKAWQEKLGTQDQKVTVQPGKNETVSFTFKQ